jgi:hypothetical protein
MLAFANRYRQLLMLSSPEAPTGARLPATLHLTLPLFIAYLLLIFSLLTCHLSSLTATYLLLLPLFRHILAITC